MTHCVAYERCSGLSQKDGDSFPRQTAAIGGFCAAHELELIREYQEAGVAGKLDEDHRPAFQQMVADLLGNGCRTVVIESLSRLARAYRTQEHLIIYLASKGITLFAADTGEDVTAAMMGDPMRRALVQIQGIFSELDKNLLVAKLAKAKLRKSDPESSQYDPNFREGKLPFGSKDGEAATLALMRKMRDERMTFQAIVDALNKAARPTRSGGPWTIGALHRILARESR